MVAIELFTQLAQIIIIATLIAMVLRKLHQPNLFAYIIAGVVIGPLVIGGFDFSFLHLPFIPGIKEITPEINLLSDLGAAFLLFSIGIETSVKRLLEAGKPLLFGVFFQVIGVILITVALTKLTGLVSLQTALFIGTILSFSSTMIVIKLLADKKETNTLNGRIMITVLLIQDFLVIIFVPLLQNVSQITDPTFFTPVIFQIFVLLAIALLANKFVFPRLFAIAAKENELFFLASISIALLFIGVSFWLTIPISIGAFIGGLALSNLPYNTAVFSKVRALRDFFLTIFFVSLGASLTFSFGGLPVLLMVAIVAIIFLIKPLMFLLLGLFSGYGSRVGLEVGVSLAQVSEFGFVIAGLGAAALLPNGNPIISHDLLSFIIAISALSMIITPHLMGFSPRIGRIVSDQLNKYFKLDNYNIFNKKLNSLSSFKEKEKLKGHIVIIGGGLVGRRLARRLSVLGKISIIDSDPEIVLQGKKDGFDMAYGTAEDIEVLEEMNLEGASAVVVTVPHKSATDFINAIKRISSKTKIFALTTHFYNAEELYKIGAYFVSMPIIDGPSELQNVLSYYKKTGRVFVNEKARIARIKYVKEQSKEEKNYRKHMMM